MAGFQGILGFLFGSSGSGNDADDALIAKVVEEIVDTVEPRIRLVGGYQKRLAAGARHTLDYLRSLRNGLPEDVVTLARTEWGRDARVNAFFATGDDVPALLGRSRDLRALFKGVGAGAGEAFALLAMKLEERRILAPKLVGDQLHQEVPQTAVGFQGHRLFAPALTLPDTRIEVGRRLFVRLAQVALRRIVEADERATDLNQRKAYLGTRLRLLNLAKDGLGGIVDDPATIDQQIREVERDMKATVDEYIEVKSGIATMDTTIDRVNDVLDNPEKHIRLLHTPLRVNRLGIKLEPGEEDATANDITLHELDFGDLRVAIAMVRCLRAELPPEEDLVAKAERYL
jgi:hypothetical protein